MSKLFFNSNKETGQKLAASERKAKTQNERVLEFFKRYPALGRTAWDVYSALTLQTGLPQPCSSFRRACTTLTDHGLLKETGKKKKGFYGKDNRTYIITSRGLKHKTK